MHSFVISICLSAWCVVSVWLLRNNPVLTRTGLTSDFPSSFPPYAPRARTCEPGFLYLIATDSESLQMQQRVLWLFSGKADAKVCHRELYMILGSPTFAHDLPY